MKRLSRRAVVLLGVAVLVLAGLATGGTWLATRSWPTSAQRAFPATGSGGYGPGMMGGGYGNGGHGAYGGNAGPIGSEPDDRQITLGNQVPDGATVDKASRTVRVGSSTADLVFVASPQQGPDLAFRMAGLTNPTVLVPVGAKVRVTLVNADESMNHDWLLTAAAPPYPATMMMMGRASFPGAATAMLPYAGAGGMPTQTTSFTASRAGTYHYLCSYPGHAVGGMYGKLIVANP